MTGDASLRLSNLPLEREREYFEQLQAGDRSALRVIYQHHQRAVYWAAYSVILSKLDAEEILQDTFMTLWNKRTSITLVGDSTLPWLVTTARFLAQNRRRSVLRHPTGPPVDQLTAGEDLPERAALTAEFTRQIESILIHASPIDRDIFRLCMVNDLSYKQAAYELGVTHATVRNRLGRLRTRLRIELDVLRGGEQ